METSVVIWEAGYPEETGESISPPNDGEVREHVELRAETEVAIRAARLARELADSRRGADQVTSKGGRDLVTATDIACEDSIRETLSAAFPEYPIVGEERGGEPSRSTPYWLVDPICGTRVFASGLPMYCTNIALVEEGAVRVAAVAVGRSDEVIYAQTGSGAWARDGTGDRKLAASDQNQTIWIDGKRSQTAGVVSRALALNQWYVWVFSSSVFYAHLAAGRISGILHFRKNRQDPPLHTAAGCFLAEEAGAIVSDAETGGAWTLETRSILAAATPALASELTRLL